nr:MAG TPA: hypothetical protein [Caudoviricetes sp.]
MFDLFKKKNPVNESNIHLAKHSTSEKYLNYDENTFHNESLSFIKDYEFISNDKLFSVKNSTEVYFFCEGFESFLTNLFMKCTIYFQSKNNNFFAVIVSFYDDGEKRVTFSEQIKENELRYLLKNDIGKYKKIFPDLEEG